MSENITQDEWDGSTPLVAFHVDALKRENATLRAQLAAAEARVNAAIAATWEHAARVCDAAASIARTLEGQARDRGAIDTAELNGTRARTAEHLASALREQATDRRQTKHEAEPTTTTEDHSQ